RRRIRRDGRHRDVDGVGGREGALRAGHAVVGVHLAAQVHRSDGDRGRRRRGLGRRGRRGYRGGHRRRGRGHVLLAPGQGQRAEQGRGQRGGDRVSAPRLSPGGGEGARASCRAAAVIL